MIKKIKIQNLNQIFYHLSFALCYYFVICALLFVINPMPAFAQGAIGDYLCEIAESYYLNGQYEDALHEFKKALLADPENVKARKYVAKLSGKPKEPSTPLPFKKESPRKKDPALISRREPTPENISFKEILPKMLKSRGQKNPEFSPKKKYPGKRLLLWQSKIHSTNFR